MEEQVMPYLTAFANFRDDVRKVAREQKGKHIFYLKYAVRLYVGQPY